MSKRLLTATVLVGVVIAAALAAGPVLDTLTWSSPAAHFRGAPARTGVYPGSGVPELTGVKWRLDARMVGAPAVRDSVVYMDSGDNHLYALDVETGQEIWPYNTRGLVDYPPAVTDSVVYVGSPAILESEFVSHVYALDAETGKERWRFKIGGSAVSSPVVADSVVYIGKLGERRLYRLRAGRRDGTEALEHSGPRFPS